MHRDYLQGEQKPEVRRAVVPWGRLLNDGLSPLIGEYGELVGRLLEKLGIADVEANRRVDEFKNIVEQLGTIEDARITVQKVVSKEDSPRARIELGPAATKDPHNGMDKKLAARIPGKSVSLLYRTYEAWKMAASEISFKLRDESYRLKLNARKRWSVSHLKRLFLDWVKRLFPIGRSSITSTPGIQLSGSGGNETENSDAEFLGWQRTNTGEDVALYNVTAERHPLYRSTVSEKTLIREKLEVPPTPRRER